MCTAGSSGRPHGRCRGEHCLTWIHSFCPARGPVGNRSTERVRPPPQVGQHSKAMEDPGFELKPPSSGASVASRKPAPVPTPRPLSPCFCVLRTPPRGRSERWVRVPVTPPPSAALKRVEFGARRLVRTFCPSAHCLFGTCHTPPESVNDKSRGPTGTEKKKKNPVPHPSLRASSVGVTFQVPTRSC